MMEFFNDYWLPDIKKELASLAYRRGLSLHFDLNGNNIQIHTHGSHDAHIMPAWITTVRIVGEEATIWGNRAVGEVTFSLGDPEFFEKTLEYIRHAYHNALESRSPLG